MKRIQLFAVNCAIVLGWASTASAGILECGWTSAPARVQSGTNYTIGAYAVFEGDYGGSIDLYGDNGSSWVSGVGRVTLEQTFNETGNKTLSYVAMVCDDTGPMGAEYLEHTVEIYIPSVPPTVSLTVNGTTVTGGAPAGAVSVFAGSTLQISASAADSDGDFSRLRVWTKLNDAAWVEVRNVATTTDSFQQQVLTVGQLQVRCQATDTWGLQSAFALINANVAAAPTGDADSDGMLDAWENANGLNAQDPSDALLDPDGDGFTNIAEYNRGTNPRDSSSPGGLNSALPAAYSQLAAGASSNVVVGFTKGQLTVDKNGAANYEIPIAVTPGVAGMEPKLSLTYSSQAGNGIAGYGWSLGGVSSITRGPQTKATDGQVRNVTLTNQDRFYLDGQRLIAISGTYGASGTEYRTEIESFTRIVSYGTSGNGPQRFRVWTKAGLIFEYGYTADSRRADANGTVLSWGANRVEDSVSNYMVFTYELDSTAGTQLISRIDYTGHSTSPVTAPFASTRFEYEARPDGSLGFVAGMRFAQAKRLRRISSRFGETEAKSYTLTYDERPVTGRSVLASIKETGKDGLSYPPLSFTYTNPDGGWTALDSATWAPPAPLAGYDQSPRGTGFVDLNGDGRPDFVRFRTSQSGSNVDRAAWLNTPSGWVPANGENGGPDFRPPYDLAVSYWTTNTSFVDVNADGLPDCVSGKNGTVYINTGSGFSDLGWSIQEPPYMNDYGPFSEITPNKGVFVDLNGDGLVDYLGLSTVTVYDENGENPTTYDFANSWINEGKTAGISWQNWSYAGGYYLPYFPDLKLLRFYDVNGDGLLDMVYRFYADGGGTITHRRMVYFNTGEGWTTGTVSDQDRWQPPEVLFINGRPFDCEMLDFNGDGLVDLLRKNDGGSYPCPGTAYFNTGAGWAVAPSEYQPPHALANNLEPRGAAFLDVNNDGLPDAVQAYGQGRAIRMGRSVGGWAPDSSWNYGLPRELGDAYRSGKGCDFIDINGDGAIDQVWNWNYYGTIERGVYINKRVNPDRLIRITSGTNVVSSNVYTEISYAPLTDSGVYTKSSDLPNIAEREKVANITGTAYVVSSVRYDTGPGQSRTVSYTYGGLRSHERYGSLGFAWMSAIDTNTYLRETTYFRQDYPYVGMPSAKVVKGPNGTTTVSETHYDYAQQALPWNGTHFVFTSEVVTKSYDLNGEYITGSSTETTYDSWGNATVIDVQTLAADNSLEAYRKITSCPIYDRIVDAPSEGASRWYLGRLRRSSVTSYGPDQGSAAPSQITRTSAFDYDASTGLLRNEYIEPDIGDDPYNIKLTTAYGYDAFGNKTSVTVSGGGMTSRTSSTLYDTRGRFPVSSTNAKNQSETYVYDDCLGVVLSVTGPNQLTTSWQYDGMGRKILETRPATNPAVPNTTTVNYRWCSSAPSGAAYQVETIQAGAPPSLVLFDAWGRQLYTFGINPGPVNGTPCVTGARTWYDASGRPYRTSLPFYYTTGCADPSYATHTTYDALGRPIAIYTADDDGNGGVIYRESTVVYNGRQTVATNPKGQVTVTLKNSQGQVSDVTQNATSGNANEVGHTSYVYDPLGQLCSTTVHGDGSASSVTTSLTYDLRGRKRSMDDPDMGAWSYLYNAAGELIWQRDAKGQTVTMDYDVLGRLVLRTEAEGTTVWSYDNAVNGVGKLASVAVSADRGKAYSESYTYDSVGRPYVLARTIDGTTYNQAQFYDDYGRPSITSYPTYYRVKNVYDGLGFLREVRDARLSSISALGDTPANFLYWRADGYSLSGAVCASTFGNGVTYDRLLSDVTGRVNAIVSGLGTGVGVQDVVYTYDSIGNVTRRIDYATGRDESYGYDGLNRLTSASLTAGPSIPGQPAAIAATYDALGNIRSKTNAGTSFVYGENNNGPHAVTSVSGGALGTRSYNYDDNGNMTWDGQRSFSWTSFNQIQSINQSGRTTQFWFGANHERVVQQDSGGATTIYIGSLMEIVTTGNLVERKHYIYTPAGRVAVRTERSDSGFETRFLHQDALGSITAVTNEFGTVEQRFVYDAWGLRIQASITRSTTGGVITRGYTDHEHLDGFGLVHMNGRIYDPVLGRFLSADPFIQSPGDSQSYNRYSYCMNNPVNLTDPSGYSWKSFFKNVLPAIIGIVVAVVVTIYCPPAGASMWGSTFGQLAAGAAAGGFASGFSGSLLNGGSIGDAFKNGLIGAAAGVATVGGAYLGGVLGSAITSGLVSEVTEDNFSHGFYGGLVGGVLGSAGRSLSNGNWYGGLVCAAVAGGTTSAMGGGKFANGAVTGAFAYIAYNPPTQEQLGFAPNNAGGDEAGRYAPTRPGTAAADAIRHSSVLGIFGKIWNLPNTAIGLVWGTLGFVTEAVMYPFTGKWDYKMSFGNNAIQFENHPLMFGAITLGNTISYANDFGPTVRIREGTVGGHERQHTYQGQVLGPLYLISNGLGLGAGTLFNGNTHGPANWNEVGPQSKPPRPWPWK